MQVVAGTYRGLKLQTPVGEHTRPTLSRVKEAFFSSIQHDIAGARFLDLFAGTGQMGIEALSRGAQWVAFCDNTTSDLIQSNLHHLDKSNTLTTRYRVLAIDSTNPVSLAPLAPAFDYIYIDPPHGVVDFAQLLDTLQHTGLADAHTTVLIEQQTTKPVDYPSYRTTKHKVYGKTMLTYLTPTAQKE